MMEGTLSKTLFYYTVRVIRVPAVVSLVYAADSIAHAIASLVLRSFDAPEDAIQSMSVAIREIEFFLQTVYGDSKDFSGSTIRVKFQGLCQGNGATPAG